MKQLFQLALSLLASGTNAISNGVNATCKIDGSIEVRLDYNRTATHILGITYGNCSLGASQITGADSENTAGGWDLTFTNPQSCGMSSLAAAGVLRQKQEAYIYAGMKDGSIDLIMVNYTVDTDCGLTSEFTVNFNYDTNIVDSSFVGSAGNLNFTFSLDSYNQTYSAPAPHSTSAGDMVYLGLTVTSADFNHAASIQGASTGRVFVPKKCTFSGEGYDYTLYDASGSNGSCSNSIVDLRVVYKASENMWMIEHRLFLLGEQLTGTYQISCNVLVCDASRPAACDEVSTRCS